MISNHLAKLNIAAFTTIAPYLPATLDEKTFSLPSVHVCYLICLYTYKILSNLSCFLAIRFERQKKTNQNYPSDDKDYHIIHPVYAINTVNCLFYILLICTPFHITQEYLGLIYQFPVTSSEYLINK